VVGEADGCEMPASPVVIPASGSFNEAMQTAIKSAIDAMASNVERAGALHFLADQMERLLQNSADAEAGREARLIRQGLTRRWGKLALAEESVQSAAIAAAAARRALVIDDLVPVNERDAGSNAILSHMRALRTLGFDVSFVSAASMAADDAVSAALAGRDIHHCALPYYASVEEVLRRQAGCFDLIYIHRAANAARYLALVRHYNRRARIIYSVADLHFLRLARQAKVEGRPGLAALSTRLRQTELTAAAQANAVITHSNIEAELLRQAVSDCNVHVVPWAVPLRPAPPAWRERRGVAFIGSFDHTPNVDAARFLVEQIMPRVWRSSPALPCLLVGSGANVMLDGLTSERVQLLGHVPRLGTVFDRVRLTVAPLRYGAGVKGKVLDSLAAGVPCILSPIAAEGIPLPESLANTVLADVEAFAAQILSLHEDPAAAAAAARAGCELIGERYSDAAVVERLRAVVEGRRAGEA
jgi:glycosyltransferase involved in cell wall biosynthesis